MRPLTMKQEKFVNGLIKGLSQREAYKQAYNAKKMKDSTIDRKACELMQNGKVSARFNEINGKVVKKAEEKSIASALEVMQYYTSLLRGEAKDISVNYSLDGKVIENEVSPTLRERTKAADALAKRYGLFIDKQEVINTNLNVEVDETEAARILKAAGIDPSTV